MRAKETTTDYLPSDSKLTFIRDGKIIDYGSTKCKFGIYKCSCGNFTEVSINNAKRGKVRSCGCYMKEVERYNYKHGLQSHPLFRVWSDIKSRCYNNKRDSWKYYGAKGVVMCEGWKNDFKSFYDWAIKNSWQKGMQIDKDIIPKKLGIPPLIYSPEYCSIVSVAQNCNSRSTNHPLTLGGITKNMTEWERELGYPKDLIYQRLKYGWSTERALTTPLRKRK